MAELGVISATVQLLDQAIRVLGRIRKAHQRQKALPEILAQHEAEIGSIKSIIITIDDEESLQSESIVLEVQRLKGLECKLSKLLEDLDPKRKGSVQKFTRQLTKGSSDESRLTGIMNELGQVKQSLVLRIQLAQVGVMRNEQGHVADTSVIERVDRFLREEIGGCCEGLLIARLLKGRRPASDGNVPVTLDDLNTLREASNDDDSDNGTLVNEMYSPRVSETLKHHAMRNVANDHAMQVNAPLGKSVWKNVEIVIEDNFAHNESVQINSPNSLADMMSLMRLKSELKMAEQLQTLSFQHNGILASPP